MMHAFIWVAALLMIGVGVVRSAEVNKGGVLPAAAASAVPAKAGITVQQAQDLLAGLRAIDQGSVDQCPAAATPPPPAPPPGGVAPPVQPAKTCPFKKSTALIRAMAQDLVALQTADNEFKIQVNAIRLEVLAQVPTAGVEQDAKFSERMNAVYAQAANVPPLRHIKWADLDVGDPPDHNRMPAGVVAALAPIIDDFE